MITRPRPVLVAVVTSLLGGCVVVGGAGLSTRDGHPGVAQLGVQSAVLPYHVGPLIGLAYRNTSDGHAAVLQGGIRVEKHDKYVILDRGPHGRVAIQRAFGGEQSATGLAAAAGYHWQIYDVELEYVREGAENDVCVLFGVDIIKAFAGAISF